jgi:hypothetical protein
MIGHNRCFLRACLLAASALAIIIIAASLPTVSANQECLQVREDFDLHSLARNDNVLLIVHDRATSRSPNIFCAKLLKNPTPQKISANGRPTVFAYLEVTATTRSFANTLNVDHFPSFLFISAGSMDGTSNYSDHIAIYKQETDELDTTEFSDFLVEHVGFSPLGIHLFKINIFDKIASLFVSYGNASGLNRLKQKGLVLLVKIIAFIVEFTETQQNKVGNLYNRAFAMSLEHGMDYCKLQVDRTEQILQAGHLRPGEYYQLEQENAILQSFSQPMKRTAVDDLKIVFHIALPVFVGLTVIAFLTFATIFLFFFPLPPEDEDDKSEEEMVINAVPVIAKVVDDD